MAEMNLQTKQKTRRVRHRGRESQVLIYLGKQLRFFINENDWKVLPMAAVVAALVGMVIRRKFFINMEGSLIGAFALTCVAIWNGCFNSIQSICRERPIIKREHRSGMHISAYVAAHMIYQFFLCLVQTGLSMYVLLRMGVQFPEKGFMTSWMMLDLGISMLLITYASDMLSLLISSLAHTTTGAMTVMPFVLIFQLVFSGGIIPLPEWSKSLSSFTISNYGIQTIAAQSGYNELPMVTAWNTLAGMKNNEINATFTVDQILDLLDSPALQQRRDKEAIGAYTVGEAAEIAEGVASSLHLREKADAISVSAGDLARYLLTSDTFQKAEETWVKSKDDSAAISTAANLLLNFINQAGSTELQDKLLSKQISLGRVIDALHIEDMVEKKKDEQLNGPITWGMIMDAVQNSEWLQARRDHSFTVKTTVGELLDLFGEENVKTLVQEKTAAASRNPAYERTTENIVGNWVMLGLFILLYALLSVISLELIDKDKR